MQGILCFSLASTSSQHSSVVSALVTSTSAIFPPQRARSATGWCNAHGVAQYITSQSPKSHRSLYASAPTYAFGTIG